MNKKVALCCIQQAKRVLILTCTFFLMALTALPSFALQINGHSGDNNIFASGAGDGASAPSVILGNALSSTLIIGEDLFGSRSAVSVMAFGLPALSPGDTIANAMLTYTVGTSLGPLQYNVDLYGLGFRSTGNVLVDDFFIGLNDTTNATLLQDNLYAIGDVPGVGQVSTSAAANAALTAYLNAQYAAGATGGIGGDNIFLRFNPDAYDVSPASRLLLTSGGNTTGAGPRINFDIVGVTAVPESSTIILLATGLAGIVGYNRWRRTKAV